LSRPSADRPPARQDRAVGVRSHGPAYARRPGRLRGIAMQSFDTLAPVAGSTPMHGESLADRYLELRERAATYGLQTLAEAETLELYLCRIAPAEAGRLAAALLVRFG